MNNELEAIQPASPVIERLPEEPAPSRGSLSVVEYAVQSGAPVAEVRALVEMQIQMDKHRMDMQRYQDERDKELRAEESRKSYFRAMAEFKSEDVKIFKNVDVKDGPLKGRSYANLFAWTSAVTKALAGHGLSFTYKTDETPEFIAVTCIMRHQNGHEERETQVAKADGSGAKNAIQAAGSAKKYMQRYTLQSLLGMAEQDDEDDDGGQQAGAEAALMHRLIGEAQATTTDAEAAAYWKANNKALVAWPYAYEKFKQAVAAHRTALKGKAVPE